MVMRGGGGAQVFYNVSVGKEGGQPPSTGCEGGRPCTHLLPDLPTSCCLRCPAHTRFWVSITLLPPPPFPPGCRCACCLHADLLLLLHLPHSLLGGRTLVARAFRCVGPWWHGPSGVWVLGGAGPQVSGSSVSPVGGKVLLPGWQGAVPHCLPPPLATFPLLPCRSTSDACGQHDG